MKNKILIGNGIVSWNKVERQSDRYGTISMFNTGKLFIDTINKYLDKQGKLICEILETRASYHIGDLYHGFFPQTPKIGDMIELGNGKLFIEKDEYYSVGLSPVDNRATFWLDPKKLYNIHNQTINLFFEVEE